MAMSSPVSLRAPSLPRSKAPDLLAFYLTVVAALLAWMVASPGVAETVFSQWPPASTGVFSVDPQQIAENFVLPQPASVDTVVFGGEYSNTPTYVPTSGQEEFVVRFFNSVGIVPATTPMYEVTVFPEIEAAGPGQGSAERYIFTATLPAAVALRANEVLWLSILDLDTDSPTFFWNGIGNFDAGATDAHRNTDVGTWVIDYATDDRAVILLGQSICGSKVLVCHVPAGNPANEHNVCISDFAVPAHLAHGDRLGPCSP